jgi:nucleoside-diphosphate-sugar epimerase
MKVAVIGASGFVGLRLVERLHLEGRAEVVPIVHAYRSLAVLARFNLPWQVVDPTNRDALATALRGCDSVVHAALGDAKQIVAMAEALYPAAERAGLRRIVALSSAAVHTLTPAPGTDESCAPIVRQASDYNRAKAEAENRLTAARRRGSVELVQLRPGIVHGPRSRLVADLAAQLQDGTAWLVNEGKGICNAIAVDNLIDAIWLALTRPEADREVFLVNDRETVTWRDFYTAIAAASGADPTRIHPVVPPAFRTSPSERLARLAATDLAMSLMPLIPARAKRLAKAAAAAWHYQVPPDPWRLPDPARPHLTREMCELQACPWRFPTAKAERILGYAPGLTFAAAMERTAAWLRFAGVVRA